MGKAPTLVFFFAELFPTEHCQNLSCQNSCCFSATCDVSSGCVGRQFNNLVKKYQSITEFQLHLIFCKVDRWLVIWVWGRRAIQRSRVLVVIYSYDNKVFSELDSESKLALRERSRLGMSVLNYWRRKKLKFAVLCRSVCLLKWHYVRRQMSGFYNADVRFL